MLIFRGFIREGSRSHQAQHSKEQAGWFNIIANCCSNQRIPSHTTIAVCNDIGRPSFSLFGTFMPGIPMHSLSFSTVGVTAVAQLQ
jgi:hypothetical protein